MLISFTRLYSPPGLTHFALAAWFAASARITSARNDSSPQASRPQRSTGRGVGQRQSHVTKKASEEKWKVGTGGETPARGKKKRLTSPRGILEQRDVDGAGGQVDVAHDGPADKHVLDGAEVGVPQLLVDRDVVELDVEVLVDRFQGARHLDVVLELDGDGLVDEGLEEAVFSRAGAR